MTAKKFVFTKRSIESLPVPVNDSRPEYMDVNTPCLGLRVTKSGAKSFFYSKRISGRKERLTIGQYPAVTVDQARKIAAQYNGVVANGLNPAVEVRSIRQEVTLGEMFEIYIERYAKIHKKTWRIDEQRYNCHATKLSSWKLSSINSGDIKELVHYVARHKRQNKQVINGRTVVSRAGGEGAANQMLRLLKTVFNYAISEQWKGDNPCAGIKEYPSQPRDRFLDKSEMPNFFKALSELQNHTMRDFFLMSLFTGARKANVMAMRWDQVNFDKATWFIPRTKNGTSHEVPLVEAALTLLELRKGLTVDDNAWVFMSSYSKSGHIESPEKAWKSLLSKAGIVHYRGTRIHDLRRSMGSWQVNLGSSLAIIGKSLNHKNLATTAIYAHVNKDPVRQSMEKASVAMIAASDKLGDEL